MSANSSTSASIASPLIPAIAAREQMTAEFEEIFAVDGGGLGVGFHRDPSVYWVELDSQAHRDLKEALATRRNSSDELWLQVKLITAKKGSQNATIVSALGHLNPRLSTQAWCRIPPCADS